MALGNKSIGRDLYKKPLKERIVSDLKRNWIVYLMVLPVVAWYIIFCYAPMYGVTMAFQNYKASKGFFGSDWIGFKNFIDFFNDVYFWRIIKNTLRISLLSLFVGWPAPIFLALLINECKNKYFVKSVQTITYLPHFISLVVICGMIKSFTGTNGIITNIIEGITGNNQSILTMPQAFPWIYVISTVWQEVGWGSIIYLSALSAIDQELYEACEIDGGGRWRQTIHVTIPGILPTIITLLILKMGSLLSVGYEKIILLYNESTMETAEVISSYVYKRGLIDSDFSYATAIGLFNSLINIFFIVSTNAISRRVSETSLW